MKPAEADLVLGLFYRYAADPTRWAHLMDVLPAQDLTAAPVGAMAELAQGQEVARLSAKPGEGPNDETWRADIGWLVLSAAGAVLACSPMAASALAELGRAAVGSALDFNDPDNGEAVDQALAQIQAGAAQVVVRLQRRGGEGPAFAYATPAAALMARVGRTGAKWAAVPGAVAVVFPAPDAASRLWVGVQESFGLTEAEVRLARKLREGLSLQQAADTLGVSINTVRNQLRAIFDKMGLTRQSDLVRALTELGAVAGVLDVETTATDLSRVMADAPPVQRMTLREGRVLAYRDYGTPTGQPVLYFHEGMGSSLTRPGTQGLAAALNLRVIAAERPGYGQSDPVRTYSFEGVADDMAELCDRLDLKTVRIVGALSGGLSALATAERLGERVEMVLLLSGRAPRTQDRANQPPNFLSGIRARLEANPWIVEALFTVLRLRRSRALTRNMARAGAISPGDRAFIENRPEAVDYLWAFTGEALARSIRGPTDELKAFRRARQAPPYTPLCPVTVWHGAEDGMTSLPELLDYLGPRVGEVRQVEGIGHYMILKHWREILVRVAAGPGGEQVG